jgi:hypothetical protein
MIGSGRVATAARRIARCQFSTSDATGVLLEHLADPRRFAIRRFAGSSQRDSDNWLPDAKRRFECTSGGTGRTR